MNIKDVRSIVMKYSNTISYSFKNDMIFKTTLRLRLITIEF
jgi:hypothetical protein